LIIQTSPSSSASNLNSQLSTLKPSSATYHLSPFTVHRLFASLRPSTLEPFNRVLVELGYISLSLVLLFFTFFSACSFSFLLLLQIVSLLFLSSFFFFSSFTVSITFLLSTFYFLPSSFAQTNARKKFSQCHCPYGIGVCFYPHKNTNKHANTQTETSLVPSFLVVVSSFPRFLFDVKVLVVRCTCDIQSLPITVLPKTVVCVE
jgi:hypothetical protein